MPACTHNSGDAWTCADVKKDVQTWGEKNMIVLVPMLTNASVRWGWLGAGLALGFLAGWFAGHGRDTAAAEPARAVQARAIQTDPAPAQAAVTLPDAHIAITTAQGSDAPPVATAPAPQVQPMRIASATARTLPRAEVPLQLLGTVTGTPKDSIALIAHDSSGKQTVYVLGAMVLPGIRLEQIDDERVVLSNRGRLEILRLSTGGS